MLIQAILRRREVSSWRLRLAVRTEIAIAEQSAARFVFAQVLILYQVNPELAMPLTCRLSRARRFV